MSAACDVREAVTKAKQPLTIVTKTSIPEALSVLDQPLNIK